MIIFESVTEKVEQVFLELAEEVIRTNPKTKREFKETIKEYSYKEDNKWQFEKHMTIGGSKSAYGTKVI